MTATVAWIHVAPIKSLRIEERRSVVLTARGIADDRRFAIVDENGRWLNAKRVPSFVAVRPEFDGDRLTLHLPDGRRVSDVVELGDPVDVNIYRHRVSAHEVLGPFTEALSAVDGRAARLVRLDEAGSGVDRAGEGGAVTLLSVGALDAIAEAAQADGGVDPRRFRMNIGIAGVPAHAEDAWIARQVRIGDAVVVPLGNVGRCAVTTLDPVTGVSDLDTLAALARYRAGSDTSERLPFGVWARVARAGSVSVGDPVELVGERVAV